MRNRCLCVLSLFHSKLYADSVNTNLQKPYILKRYHTFYSLKHILHDVQHKINLCDSRLSSFKPTHLAQKIWKTDTTPHPTKPIHFDERYVAMTLVCLLLLLTDKRLTYMMLASKYKGSRQLPRHSTWIWPLKILPVSTIKLRMALEKTKTLCTIENNKEKEGKKEEFRIRKNVNNIVSLEHKNWQCNLF